MKVILLENVKRIGSIGEVIDVKRGFARNFLIANKKGKQSNFAKLSIFQPNKYKFKKTCPLSVKGAPEVDYKNIKLLKKYVSENGKILPSRITNVSQKKQRELSLSVKRARNLALI